MNAEFLKCEKRESLSWVKALVTLDLTQERDISKIKDLSFIHRKGKYPIMFIIIPLFPILDMS